MTAVRVAKAEDKKAFYDLWKICFGDSDAFCDWFFRNRFAPDYSVVLETQGKIVICMQSFPLHHTHLRFCRAIFPSGIFLLRMQRI